MPPVKLKFGRTQVLSGYYESNRQRVHTGSLGLKCLLHVILRPAIELKLNISRDDNELRTRIIGTEFAYNSNSSTSAEVPRLKPLKGGFSSVGVFKEITSYLKAAARGFDHMDIFCRDGERETHIIRPVEPYYWPESFSRYSTALELWRTSVESKIGKTGVGARAKEAGGVFSDLGTVGIEKGNDLQAHGTGAAPAGSAGAAGAGGAVKY
ncbi:hypothetical protein B0H16DRAFT_1463062 [Mycena metata]|uniref:Uncharacterized protein n=1 Tax=Mycena metata TaxID=1033252 RepID=A0AAD7DPS9_9AGAR|nr:hypothetical protein B0H16DRAFT_1485363 [Mycena metata]KAJ7744919.1 hypothetical protein B0H16DRAFT_1463062 [Mycena metata]